MSFRFELLATDACARRGRLHTAHGEVETPAFMAVGTQATVKGLTPTQLAGVGVQVVLANTYHLTLRPGDEVIAQLGGLHRFMGWPKPILTDSGGYQIFSLAANLRIDNRAAVFRSHLDGSLLELTPEKAVQIQENLGADIAMCLDECPPGNADPAVLRRAVDRTLLWAKRCRQVHRRSDQALFAIVQGGTDAELRVRCADALTAMDFPGYALGGFSVGESRTDWQNSLLGPTLAHLPASKPRYLMGMGRPQDILEAVASGVDMFDCVLPTRNGRTACAFTPSGLVRIRNACHRLDSAPLEEDCPCPVCREFSRAYLHHLFLAGEMLGPTLLSLHNLAYYNRLLAEIRRAIEEGRWKEFYQLSLARFGATP